MGDLEVLAIQPNVFLLEDQLLIPQSPPPLLSNPSPSSISDNIWTLAEETTQLIVRNIQPTVVSEQRRKEVIEHVQGLIKDFIGCEVFPFGSVPLKTYLPDGDIDLTALSIQTADESLANDVRDILEMEEQCDDSYFEVKDVQYIHAEVKLVKCLVQNIVVDISFNQLGGICTLCFLEQVDRLIGKNHLFKRSIILIKAWCYYESRILGAHHGLISTYALETMVLYIFHLFHSSLNGPLAVLYRFLDYYSKFDWDNFCISLNGPVSLSSLPEIVAETPDNDGGELLLDKEFLNHCVNMFSVPPKGVDTTTRSFQQKHINIIDPLKENNNLGRSVSKGNFYRIRSAFTFGARKLGQILLLTANDVVDELNKFFTNTLDRHGNGQRPDVQGPTPASSVRCLDLASSNLAVDGDVGSQPLLKSESFSSSSTVGADPMELQNGSSNGQLSGVHKKSSTGDRKEPQRCTTGLGSSSLEVLERLGFLKENAFSGCRLVGEAEEHTISKNPGQLVTIRTESMSQSSELVTSPLGTAQDASHPYLSPVIEEHEKIGTRSSDQLKAKSIAMHENNTSCPLSQGNDRDINAVYWKDNGEIKLAANHNYDWCENGLVTVGETAAQSVSTVLDPGEASSSNTGGLGAFNSLSDLSGDYDSHVNSLLCAQWCHDYAFSGSYMPPRPLPSQFPNNLHQPMQYNQNVFPHINANGVYPRPAFFPVHPPMISGAAFGVEEFAKPRGTGTYFPNMNEGSYKEFGRRSAPPAPQAHMVRPLCDNNWPITTPETQYVEKFNHAPRRDKFFPPAGRSKPLQPGFFQDVKPMSRASSHPNGFTPPLDKVEFGTFGQGPSRLPLSPVDASRRPVTIKCPDQLLRTPTETAPEPKPDSGVNVEGKAKEAFHLKDEADFPPLCALERSNSK